MCVCTHVKVLSASGNNTSHPCAHTQLTLNDEREHCLMAIAWLPLGRHSACLHTSTGILRIWGHVLRAVCRFFHPAKHYGHFHISIHMYSPRYLQRFKPVVFLLYSSEKFSACFFTGRSDCSHLFRTSHAGHVLAAAGGTSRRRVASPLPQVCAHHALTAPDDLVGRRGACTRQQHVTAPTSSHPAEHF